MCRRGRHTKTGGTQVQQVIRSVRRAVKRALRRGEEPRPTRSVGYTD
jgi:hypothetical protein